MANDLAPAEFHRACFWSRWIADIHYMAPCSNYKSYIVRFIEPIYPKNVCIIVWSTLILLHAIEVRIRKFRMECRCDLVIWGMAFKNNRAHLLCYIKFCASFQSHRWSQTYVTVRELSIRVKISHFFVSGVPYCVCVSCVTLEFDRWPWKTTGHFFYAASSFVHHSVAISEFKLELQSGNAQSWSKSVIFFCPVWLSNSMNDYQKQQCTSSILLYAFSIISKPLATSNLSYCPETLNSGQSQRVFNPCDLEISRMTLKNKRAPLLCSSRFFASFNCHQCIQTGVTVWKRPI